MTTASLLLALACKKTPPEAMAQQEHTQPGVYLLEAGTKAQPLRYAAQSAGSYTLVSETDLTMVMTIDGTVLPVQTPTVIMTTHSELSPTGGGGFRIDAEIVGLELGSSDFPAELTDMLRASYETVNGSTMSWTTTAAGEVTHSEFVPVEGADPAVVSSIEDMTSMGGTGLQFPNEPVGIGGRWEEVELLDAKGIQVRSHTFATLVERDGPHILVQTEVVQVPLSTELVPSDLAPGSEARILGYVSTGSGQFETDLSAPGRTQGHGAAEVLMDLEVLTPGAEEWAPMTTQLDMKTSYWTEE